MAFSAAATIEAAYASDEASATGVVQSVLASARHAKAFFRVSPLARCSESACVRAGKILRRRSDCAQVLPAKVGTNLSELRTDSVRLKLKQGFPVSMCNAGWRTLGPSSLPLAAHRLPMWAPK